MRTRSPNNAARTRPAMAQAGFTLLEVIIALALASLVAALGAVLIRTGMDYYARGNAFLDQQDEVRQAFRLFRRIASGSAGEGAGLVGKPDSIALLTDQLPLGLNLPGRQKVRLQCEVGNDAKRLMLRVIDTSVPSQPDAGERETYKLEAMLADKLQECSFNYLRLLPSKEAAELARWEEGWLAEYGAAPKAVRLNLSTAQSRLPAIVVALAP